MQTSQKPLIWTVIICTILLAIIGAFAYNGISNMIPEVQEVPTAEAIAGIVLANINIPNVPTAKQIAAEIDMPETKLSLKLDLKADSIRVSDNEFDFDEVEDLFGEDDEVTLVREYTNKREYSNINLGIDNEDDKKITVERVYKVEVEPDIGDDFKDKVYVTYVITVDDGDYEVNATYSLTN